MVNLLSASEIISRAATNRLDERLISADVIQSAQDRHLRPWMEYRLKDFNDSLYRELLTEKAAGAFSTENLVIMKDFIEPGLAQYVIYEALMNLGINLTDAGPVTNLPEGSKPASSAERAALGRSFKERGDSYADQFTRFIEQTDNMSDYPKYSRGRNIRNSVRRIGGVIVGDTPHIRIDDR